MRVVSMLAFPHKGLIHHLNRHARTRERWRKTPGRAKDSPVDDIYCAANYTDGMPPCTRRGSHLTTCQHQQDGDCHGCQPRPAVHGYLCRGHYENVERAHREHASLQELVRILHGDDQPAKAVQNDSSGSTTPGPRVPLSAIQLDLDAIDRAWSGDVTHPDGAITALVWAKRVHTAAHRYPIHPKQERLHRVRCGNCLERTAIHLPPEFAGGRDHIRCTSCNWETHDTNHIEAAAYVEAQTKDPYLRIRRPDTHGRRRLTGDRAGIAALVDAIRA